MYAVIVTGGKQHKVTEGEFLKVEKLDVATGEAIDFDRVLLVANGEDVKIGLPVVEGAKVTAEVVSHGRHDKVRIIKFRPLPHRALAVERPRRRPEASTTSSCSRVEVCRNSMVAASRQRSSPL